MSLFWRLLNLHLAMAMTTPSGSRKKVIVIGAGFSGLSVAYNLVGNESVDIEILEARDRIGGRVHPFDLDGTIVDLGGQWVHEACPQNPMRQLMEELKIPFHPRGNTEQQENDFNPKPNSEETCIFNMDGEEIARPTFKSAVKFYYKALDFYDEDEVDINTSFQDLVDKELPKTEKYATDEFKQALNYLVHRTECYEGGCLHELSVHLDEIYKNLGGPDEFPTGGYNSVLQAVADEIGREKVRMGCVVESIEYNPLTNDGKVKVKLSGSQGEVVEGDYCVCTVPLGVLQQRKISFIPELSSSRWSCIDKIGMGSLEKIVLKFTQPFWSHKVFAAAHTDQARIKSFFDCSDEVGASMLICYVGGKAAQRLEDNLTDEDAITEVMDTLRGIYGDAIPHPVSAKVTRWRVDPYAGLGSYSFTKVGSTGYDYDQVATPIGNLLFAGEHTNKNAHSTVHGAWATGQREAQRISEWIATLNKTNRVNLK
jgi:monoamine oxidase